MKYFGMAAKRLLILLAMGLLALPGCKREPASGEGPGGPGVPGQGAAGQERGPGGPGQGAAGQEQGAPGAAGQPGQPGEAGQAGQAGQLAGAPGGPGAPGEAGDHASPIASEVDIDTLKGAMKAGLEVDVLKKAPALDVTLESIDSLRKYRTIEAMVEAAGMGVGAAAELADKTPGVLVQGISKEEAVKLVDSFGELGAILSFKPGTPKAKVVKAEVKAEAAPAVARAVPAKAAPAAVPAKAAPAAVPAKAAPAAVAAKAAPAAAAGPAYEGPVTLAKVPSGVADCLVKGPANARVVIVELTDYQ